MAFNQPLILPSGNQSKNTKNNKLRLRREGKKNNTVTDTQNFVSLVEKKKEAKSMDKNQPNNFFLFYFVNRLNFSFFGVVNVKAMAYIVCALSFKCQ